MKTAIRTTPIAIDTGRIAAGVGVSIAFVAVSAACALNRSAPVRNGDYTFKRMSDRKEWLTENLNINVHGSYCYQDDELMCRQYGRLYTWDAARRACQSLREGWRLPTDAEWSQLAKGYGGVFGESADSGRSAYTELLLGGNSGFDARLGGGRSPQASEYSRLDAHGFYWTVSDSGHGGATFFNFGRGGQRLYRQTAGEKPRGFSVRCVRDVR
jgi:uncharacterized protein (TIGR02145 family)